MSPASAAHRPDDRSDNGPADRVIGCPKCGLLQHNADCGSTELAFCRRCRTPLVHCAGKNLDVALASAAATFLLLIPATFEPFLFTSAFGATRSSILPSSVFFLWREGWISLGIVVLLFVLVFPAIRFAALTAVLAAVRCGARPRWLAPTFRLANALQTWAMLDVFFFGSAVAYARLHVSIHVTVEIGAICFVAAVVLSLIVRATLDKQRIWRWIAPDATSFDLRSSIACMSCQLVMPHAGAGRPCPRCGAAVEARLPGGIARPMALLLAAVFLYFPANLYPIATIPIDITPTAYTVVGGIIDLSQAGFLGLAILVFGASFAIPLLKMLGLTWCAVSSMRHSTKRLIGKTQVYRVVEEIGRWSMVDPFTIACFVPVMHFNSLIIGRAEPAATPFAAVAILTTLAVRCFDPRRIWDAAGRHSV